MVTKVVKSKKNNNKRSIKSKTNKMRGGGGNVKLTLVDLVYKTRNLMHTKGLEEFRSQKEENPTLTYFNFRKSNPQFLLPINQTDIKQLTALGVEKYKADIPLIEPLQEYLLNKNNTNFDDLVDDLYTIYGEHDDKYKYTNNLVYYNPKIKLPSEKNPAKTEYYSYGKDRFRNNLTRLFSKPKSIINNIRKNSNITKSPLAHTHTYWNDLEY